MLGKYIVFILVQYRAMQDTHFSAMQHISTSRGASPPGPPFTHLLKRSRILRILECFLLGYLLICSPEDPEDPEDFVEDPEDP